MTFHRYVALGDSTTEGIGDTPYDDGTPRGWADRFAGMLAGADPALTYANLAVRGNVTRQVRAEQLDPALALAPDLVSLIVAMNDLIRPKFQADEILTDVEAIVTALRAQDVTVLMMTFPDLSTVSPIGGALRGRIARLNAGWRDLASRHSVLLVEADKIPAAGDPRIWAPDRLHLAPEGHDLIARAMASLVSLPGSDLSWQTPLPPIDRSAAFDRLATEARWLGRYVAPWLGRRITGRSSGDGRSAKRPELARVLTTD